jgi:hypothetical protein
MSQSLSGEGDLNCSLHLVISDQNATSADPDQATCCAG